MSATELATATERFRIAIIGTGFSGLGLAAQLKRGGQTSFVLLERASGIGGTWRDNVYPGAACDVPSHLYSFSFRLNPDWSRVYAPQPEILSYLQRTADAEGLLQHIRTDSELLDASWDEPNREWVLTTAREQLRAQVLVTATGHLCDPKLPDIPGLDEFEGQIFHSARWPADARLDGASVGVVGTGASGIQIVPQLAKAAAQLTVFQRSAPWIVPRADREFSLAERRTFQRLPSRMQDIRDEIFWFGEARFPQRRNVETFIDQIRTLALDHLADQVPDPVLRAKLTPDYTIGCKRILVSSDYYPAVSQPHVAVETAGIERFTRTGVLTRDGTEHPLDTLVLATGFEASDLPISHRVHGRDGVLLADQWGTGEQALRCVAVHNFPNLFIMNGPNAGLGAGSIIYIIESQISYLTGAIDYMSEHDVAVLEATPEAEAAFVAELEQRSRGTVWLDGGCHSWYVDPRSQRLTTIWPDFMSRYRAENGLFRAEEYHLVSSGDHLDAAVGC